MRILTTQTSYPVNNLVIDALSPETGITFYDGGRSYDSSHNPMIYHLLENYAGSEDGLEYIPSSPVLSAQFFRSPSPQFIHERMNELADKKLKNMTGYTTPSNRYFEFSVIAAAEWCWNSKGRTPKEFAEAYAVRKGIKNPELFSQWAENIGTVSWDLAGSRSIRLLLFNKGQTFNPDGSVGSEDFVNDLPLMEFGKGMLYEFKNSDQLETDMSLAGKALEIARGENDPEMIYESECVFSAVQLVKSLKEFSDARQMGKKTVSSVFR